MESKRLNRKFSSVFWWILYSLPLIALFIYLFGTFTIYKETGQDLEFTIEESYITGGSTNIEPGEYIKNIYFNTNLTIDQVYAIIDTLPMEIIGNEVYCLYADTIYEIYIFDYREQVNDGILILGANADFSDTDLIFSTSQHTETMLGITFVDGWYINDLVLEVNNTCIATSALGITVNPSDTSELASSTPFEEIEVIVKKQLSIFEKGFNDVVNDFKPFTWEVVIDTLESTFTTVGFNVNNYISSFIILIFAWFVQLTFIHILLDVILLVPRWLHHCMEGGC